MKDLKLRELKSAGYSYYNIHNLLLIKANVDIDMPDFFLANRIDTNGIPTISVHVDRDFATTNTASVGLQVHYNKQDDMLYFEHPQSSS